MIFEFIQNCWKGLVHSLAIGFLCTLMNDHRATCLADEGIQPDPVKLKAQPIEYFKVYSSLYCKRCGKVLRTL